MGIVLEYYRLPEEHLTAAFNDLNAAADLTERLWQPILQQEEFGRADADKAWDVIHFTLDSARRSGRMGERTSGLGGRVVWGARPVAERLEELEWRGYSLPPDVHAISASLSEIDFRALLTKMSEELDRAQELPFERRPYRWGDSEYSASGFERISSLYREASERGHAVLVIHN